MRDPASPPAPRPPERLLAWLLCGPVGHLAAGASDWAVLFARYGWARARGRDPWGA